MSIVIAYVTEDSIYMAGDRIAVRNNDVSYCKKVCNVGSCLVGSAGTRDLYTNILRLPPPYYQPQKYDGGFTEFINTSLQDWGTRGVFECLGAGAILGYVPSDGSCELVELDGDMTKNWFNIERLDLSISPFTAIGSGREPGKAAFKALLDRDDLSTEEKLERAIKHTCDVHLYARPDPDGNIDVIKLSR